MVAAELESRESGLNVCDLSLISGYPGLLLMRDSHAPLIKRILIHYYVSLQFERRPPRTRAHNPQEFMRLEKRSTFIAAGG